MKMSDNISGCGGIGRRARFRFWCPRRAGSSPVTRINAQTLNDKGLGFFICLNEKIFGASIWRILKRCFGRITVKIWLRTTASPFLHAENNIKYKKLKTTM